jgi:hypothetical protein
MSRSAIAVLVLPMLAGVASAAELTPADFAFGMPVVTTADAAAYRVTLPLGLYQGTVREDLADIRVFNARGEVVPYALSRPAARTQARGAEPAESRIEAERSTLEVEGSTGGAAHGEYQFDLGARLPIERVNLGLPEQNTVVGAELLSRAHPQDSWRHVAGRQFYRINTAAGEVRNAPVDIATDSDRYWLARPADGNGGASTAAPLHLQVAWTPSEVVFFARGSGPFVLAYGSAAAPAAETDLSAIPAAVTVMRAALGAPRALGGPMRLAAPAAAYPWRRMLLWGMLALCVCLLAWMAYRLSKDMGKNAAR